MRIFMLSAALIASTTLFAQTSLPDPTRPLVAQAQAAQSQAQEQQAQMRLDAVMRKGENYLAIINGKMLVKGEQINGFTVTRIDSDSVELANRQERKRLSLFNNQTTIKKEASNDI